MILRRSVKTLIFIFTFALLALWVISTRHSTKRKTELEREWQAEKVAHAEYIHYVRQIRRAFAEEMLRELQLVCSGDSGSLHEKVEELGMQFNAHRRATIEEARALQLLVMDKFAQAINAHEKIQPFLKQRPFKRVSITIAFEGPKGRCDEGAVGHVYNITDLAGVVENRNKLFYYSIDPFTQDNIKILSEFYQEAVELNKLTAPQYPYFHQNGPIEEALDQVLGDVAKDMKNEQGFECWSIGGKITNYLEGIGAKFVVLRPATQEEARKLELFTIERLINAINLNEELRPYLIEYPFPTNRLKIRICFRKKNYYNYHDGSMDSVALEDNEITYFQKPPPDVKIWSVETPIFAKESYQEALKIVGNVSFLQMRSQIKKESIESLPQHLN